MAKRKTAKASPARTRNRTSAHVAPADAPAQDAAPVDTATYLNGNLDIHGIEASYRELRGLLASGLPVVIDVSRLSSVDTAGIQLLLAVQKEAERRSLPLNLRGDSPAFSTALDRLGLTSAFATVRRHG